MTISIQNLSKVYKNGTRALDNVSFEIGKGLFGLLGPNGAGKTTLMRILTTLMNPSDGEVTINGFDIRKNRREIRSMLGYLPQDFSTFSRLTAIEFLDYSACLAGMNNRSERKKAIEQMLEKVGLYEARDRLANKLSGGMKRRLGIAQALIGNPKIIVVDEPTTGLDPEERIRFGDLLADMSREDIIIILSTHIVGDISSTCQDMAMLHNGRLVFKDSPDRLIDMARGHVWKIEARKDELEDIKQQYPVVSTIKSNGGWEVHVVAKELKGHKGTAIEPGIEHAYIYFHEYGMILDCIPSKQCGPL